MDKDALASMLKKLSGVTFSTQEVDSVFKTLGGEHNSNVTLINFILKIRNLSWLIDPNMTRKFKSEMTPKTANLNESGRFSQDPLSIYYSFSLGIIFGVVLTLGITKFSK